jgi:hypothetical protein
MKYFLLNFKIPMELIDYIYIFIEPTVLIEIRNLTKIWYKRLIHENLKLFSFQRIKIKYQLRQEEQVLESLIKEKAFKLIEDVHMHTTQNIPFKIVGNFFDTLRVEKS